MNFFKVGYSPLAEPYFNTIGVRQKVCLDNADLTNIGAAVITDQELEYVDKVYNTGFETPIFLVNTKHEELPEEVLGKVNHVIDGDPSEISKGLYDRGIEEAVVAFDDKVTPPFLKAMIKHVENGTFEYSCPGHHGGNFFRRTPTGAKFVDFMGENVFRGDLGHGAALDMGDLLLHSGVADDAEVLAAKVYNADRTFFVLNGTSCSNHIVCSALLTPGDIVLYDRNNHKSIDHGACILAGATPVFLETVRNSAGLIGGVPAKCINEEYIRKLVAEKDPVKAKAKRPIRLAVFEMSTYDGTIYNARQVLDKIGHLCDYVLFDCAWTGYEQFIDIMKDSSPLLMDLGPEDPGIIVTQSVHKQGAGWSSSSWIHKKDSHIKGQKRYCNDTVFNNAYLLHYNTSPFMPMWASIEVNARMHEGKQGKLMWKKALCDIIEARKTIFKRCHYLKPFVPPVVHGKPWWDADTETIATDLAYWKFDPEENWHGYKGYDKDQYVVDPMKLQLITPGINVEDDSFEDFGINATILFAFLRENNITPEKTSLYSLLFLITPAETKVKLDNLIAQLVRFERLVDEDAPLYEVLPTTYKQYFAQYRDYTIRQLCQEMHDFYKSNNVKELQKQLFMKDYLPEQGISAQQAHNALVRNDGELVPLSQIEGRIALDDALPYPPGVVCVMSGERWSKTATKYFQTLVDGINALPGFAPEIQGVVMGTDKDGKAMASGYVLKKELEDEYKAEYVTERVND